MRKKVRKLWQSFRAAMPSKKKKVRTVITSGTGELRPASPSGFKRIRDKVRHFYRKKYRIVVSAVLIVVIVGGTALYSARPNPDAGISMAAEQTAAVERQTIMNSISAVGTVESSDSRSITSSVSNVKVTEVLVSEGDEVKEGDILCVFDSEDVEEQIAQAQESQEITDAQNSLTLSSAQRSLASAQENQQTENEKAAENVASAQESLTEAQTELEEKQAELEEKQEEENSLYETYESVKSSYESVKAAYDERNRALSDAQAELESAEAAWRLAGGTDSASTLSSNEAQMTAAETLSAEEQEALDEAEEEMNDAQDAVYEATISLNEVKVEYESLSQSYTEAETNYNTAVQEREQLETEVEQLQETLENSETAYEDAVSSQSSTASSQSASVQDSQDNLSKTQLDIQSSNQQSENEMEEYEAQLEEYSLVAPCDGTVTSVNVTAGSAFEGGSAFVLEDCETFIITADIDEYDIADIEEGMEIVFKTDATRDEELTGTITYVAVTPEDSESGSAVYRMEASIDQDNDRLRIGMTAQMNIVLEASEDVLAVPYDAIQTDEEGNSFVYVQTDAGDSESESGRKKVEVTVGMEGDYYVEVSSDELEEGMRVILSGSGTASGSTDSSGQSEAESGHRQSYGK